MRNGSKVITVQRFALSLSLATVVLSNTPVQGADLAGAVDAAVADGTEVLLNQTRTFDEIEYYKRNGIGPVETVIGNVTRVTSAVIEIIPRGDDKKLRIQRQKIVRWVPAGYIQPEMDDYFFGGTSALAALALLSAGVEPTEPRMARLIHALVNDDSRNTGTYVHSLRAGVWSLLLERRISKKSRLRYLKLLREEASWLTRAMGNDGAYDYLVASASGDNSNTQFGNLGLWSCSIGGVEVPGSVWDRIANYWLNCQRPGGGWSYRRGRSDIGTPSMTVAGCNSLYIALDRYYAKLDQSYRLFRGCAPNKGARKKMSRIYRAIEEGDKYLESNPPSVGQYHGYELFGLERLGLASGRTHIGGIDWFRQHAETLARRSWTNGPIADAFALIFLVHGRAPVLLQKLEHNEDPNEWNYYHRDLFALSRYLTRTFERLVRWQRIPMSATVSTMENAPFLYISGNQELTLPPDVRSRIREYVDRGGTVFLHADRKGKRFIDSATKLFEKIFSDLDVHFRELDDTHPLYTCHFGGPGSEWKRHIPLKALMDGPRLLVILCPVDLAGAWHQDKRQFEDVWRIMANIRIYCAPPYNNLPLVLRSIEPPDSSVAPLGAFQIKRWAYGGEWAAHRGLWRRRSEDFKVRTGLAIQADENSDVLPPDRLMQMNMVHLTTRGAAALNRSELADLKAYLESGGLLLVESADGQSDGNLAVRRIVDSIPVGSKGFLAADHPLATGAFPGGQSLLDLETTIEGVSLFRAGTPPPILTRTLNNRIAVIACPFDLSAALDNHNIWRRVGYTRESTERIMDNILLWRFHVQHGDLQP